MDIVEIDDLKQLAQRQDGVCVSVYLPTHRSATDYRSDRILFKDLLQSCREQLNARGVRMADAETWLQPAEDRLADAYFWTHQSGGLAVFLAPDEYHEFRMPIRFPQRAVVDDSFELVPLVPAVQANGIFYVLAVSPNSCRLLRGSRFEIEEIEPANLPPDLQTALGWWREREVTLHSMQPHPQGRPGGNTAMYHGHQEETREMDLAAYFRRVDAALWPILSRSGAPLVFAGVAEAFPVYREASEYAGLAEHAIAGDPDLLSAEELHREAWAIVDPLLRVGEQRIRNSFGDVQEAGLASTNCAQILTAAQDGLVDTLLVRQDAFLPGHFDGARRRLQFHDEIRSDSSNLANIAVTHTLRNDGSVVALQEQAMPTDEPLAAMLRAPVSAARPGS